MPTHKANCDACSYEAAFSNPLRSYELADGSTVSIEKTFIWCAACREVRWGEELPDLPQLERELAAIAGREPSVMEMLTFIASSTRQTLEHLLATEVKTLESQITWRRIRKSAPRCLECGSTDISPFTLSETHDGDDQWKLRGHPGCGGVVTVLEQAVLSLNRQWFRYTPEGEKRQAYEMYAGKGAVPIDD